MRIAMIGQHGIHAGEKGGGVEKAVESISKRLVAIGHHDVFVYARRRSMPGKEKFVDGVHIIYIPTIYRKNLVAIVHTFLSTLHALFGSYDIIHYHGVGPSTLSWIPRILLSNTKVVATFHSQDRFHTKWSIFARSYLYFGEWTAVTFPHACIAVSHTIQVFCRKRFHRDTVYIPNGAEVMVVDSSDRLKKFGLESGHYILNVGRIVKHKGMEYLVKAHERLVDEFGADRVPKLVFVGAPSYTDVYFNELKKRTAGNPHIQFLGFQTGEDLKQIFAHALLYVHPSEREGLPLVILEAMSFGLPVLVSDIPENLEAIHHAGFKFKNKDVDDLTEKLITLLCNPEKLAKARERAVGTVEAYYNWDMIAEHTEEVYRTIRH
ncbi:MAG: glycosyltransferase family 4 protein [bacterium]|nr:glycosyltransferase family 4 protein [bacterium]